MNDLLILFSGGADSILLTEMALDVKRKPFCLMVDYGQVHVKELEVAQKYLNEKKLKHQLISISNLNIDSALTGNIEDEKYCNSDVSFYHIPGRNTILLSLALGVAESKQIDEIWFGADYSDRKDLFPDCYQEYVFRFNKLSEISGSYDIKIYAPLLGFTKQMVLNFLEYKYNIEKEKMFSGYE